MNFASVSALNRRDTADFDSPEPSPAGTAASGNFDLVQHEGADEDLSSRVPSAFLLCDACPDGFLPCLEGDPILS